MTLDGIFPTIAFVVPSRRPDDILLRAQQRSDNAATFPPEIERDLNH